MHSKSKAPIEDNPNNTYKFYLGSRQRYIIINSNFQSGNIQLIRQLSEFNYRLNCVDDGVKNKHKVNSKSWFYFAVKGVTKNTKVKFTVSRVQTLMAVYNHAPKSYRPVYRQKPSKTAQWSQWHRISTQSPLLLRQTGQLQVTFDYLFRSDEHQVQFAFTYPYTYTKNINYLNNLNQFYSHDQFYFHKQILTQSPQKKLIHLLTITSYDHQCQQSTQQLFDQKLFPEKCRPQKYKKPVILISARVHPGQTAASYAMQGVIDFLTNTKDVRSYLLKKMFVFMIVPMINVDGVYNGHFRMDSYGKNLNRYYKDPSFQKQPAIYAIRKLADHLITSNRLSFYFDLHAHNAKKGHFIYGNAINDFVEQVESQVFCKLFSLNDKGFEYEYCNFSQKQMKSKDRNEQRTKQGCGRVVMHKLAKIIHSYSLECGIIAPIKNNPSPKPMNQQFQLGSRGLVEPKKQQNNYFTQQSYKNLGQAMLVSILDVFDKNPYNRVYNSVHKSMQFLRRVTAFEVFHHAQRFRMFQKYVYGKVKNINQLIRQVLNSKLHYRQLYNFYFYNDDQLKNTQWPQNIPGLIKPKFTKKLRRFRSLQQPKLQYSLSFIQDLKTNRQQLEQSIIQHGQMPQQQPYFEKFQDVQASLSSQTDNEQRSQSLKNVENSNYYQQMIENGLEIHSQLLIPLENPNSFPQPDQQISRWNTHHIIHQPWLTSKALSINEKYQQEQLYLSMGKSVQLPQQPQKQIIANHSHLQNHKKMSPLDIHARQSQFIDVKLNQNQSPSMRVRRLVKNQSPKKSIKGNQVRQKINQMISHTPQIHSPFVPSNLTSYSGLTKNVDKEKEYNYHDRQVKIFEQIKSEIKQELKKHKDSKMNSVVKGQGKIKFLQQKDRARIKSTNINAKNTNSHKAKSQFVSISPSKSAIGKTHLPSLNSHILIISSNSSKGLVSN